MHLHAITHAHPTVPTGARAVRFTVGIAASIAGAVAMAAWGASTLAGGGGQIAAPGASGAHKAAALSYAAPDAPVTQAAPTRVARSPQH